MYEFYPLLLVGGVVGVFAIVFLIAYLSIKDKKAAIGYDRNMKDSEIARRLLVYAKPYTKNFIFVLFIGIRTTCKNHHHTHCSNNHS